MKLQQFNTKVESTTSCLKTANLALEKINNLGKPQKTGKG